MTEFCSLVSVWSKSGFCDGEGELDAWLFLGVASVELVMVMMLV